MIEFGATLRAAREAKGLTPAQLAQTTHLMAQQIEALENEDFSKIAAPIYGRGFVKLYCEGVGLDPKPMIAEFMEIFSGNRQPAIRMRASAPVAPAPAPAPAPMPELVPEPEAATEPAPEPISEDEPPAAGPQDFFLESEVVRTRPVPPPPAPEPEPVRPGQAEGLLFPQEEIAPTPARKPSRYAAPMPIDDDDGSFRFTLPDIPRKVWRILALALVGLFLLWLIYACLSSLYHAGMSAPSEDAASPTETVTAPAAESTAAPQTGTRSETAISPLYID